MVYDSRPETEAHIYNVRKLMRIMYNELLERAAVHDQSKMEDPELAVFDEYTPKLKHSTYGSEEYKDFLVGMSEGLKHHYKNNRHHPEHFEDGINGMNLLDLVEMICDWKAATLRHDDGDIKRSIELNAERFGYDPQLQQILMNTVRDMGMI